MGKENTVKTVKKEKVMNCRLICIGSLITSLHLSFPLIKCLNKLGTVNMVTEDKAYLALTRDNSNDYELGNIRVRIVDCISVMEESELLLDDYDFSVLDVKEFIPSIQVDKYIFLSNRDFFRQQILESQYKHTPTYSVFRKEYHTTDERRLAEGNIFVNEEFLPLKSFTAYDKMMYNLMIKQNFSVQVPPDLVIFLASILEGYHNISRNNVRDYLKEANF